MLFDLQMSMCQLFNGLNPMIIRRYPAHEVFLLIKRVNKKADRTGGTKGGKVRKQAGDDWF